MSWTLDPVTPRYHAEERPDGWHVVDTRSEHPDSRALTRMDAELRADALNRQWAYERAMAGVAA